MKFRPKRSARENAARVLPRLADAFFRAGDDAFQEELRGEELHDFRIRTKRFRYVLEYFRPCYGRALDAYLESVRGLQAVLGDLNDCCAARKLLTSLGSQKRPPPRFPRLFGALERREQDLYHDYRTYWTSRMQDALGRRRFLRYLANPPRRVRPAEKGRRARPRPTRARGKAPETEVALPLSGATS